MRSFVFANLHALLISGIIAEVHYYWSKSLGRPPDGKSNGIRRKSYLSLVVRKPAFCICENKDAVQLCNYLRSRRDIPVGVPLDLSTWSGTSYRSITKYRLAS